MENAGAVYAAWLLVLKYTVGYGYFVERLLWCLVCFLILGTVVPVISRQRSRGEVTLGLWYSLDMLVPFLQLRKEHYEQKLSGFCLYYFYIHRLAGFLLVSILLAAVTGVASGLGN